MQYVDDALEELWLVRVLLEIYVQYYFLKK